MNTKIPRSFAVGCSLAVLFLVFIGIALTQSSSAGTGNLQVGLETTTTPANNGVNMPPGQINSVIGYHYNHHAGSLAEYAPDRKLFALRFHAAPHL